MNVTQPWKCQLHHQTWLTWADGFKKSSRETQALTHTQIKIRLPVFCVRSVSETRAWEQSAGFTLVAHPLLQDKIGDARVGKHRLQLPAVVQGVPEGNTHSAGLARLLKQPQRGCWGQNYRPTSQPCTHWQHSSRPCRRKSAVTWECSC